MPINRRRRHSFRRWVGPQSYSNGHTQLALCILDSTGAGEHYIGHFISAAAVAQYNPFLIPLLFESRELESDPVFFQFTHWHGNPVDIPNCCSSAGWDGVEIAGSTGIDCSLTNRLLFRGSWFLWVQPKVEVLPNYINWASLIPLKVRLRNHAKISSFLFI